jgi:hypothetical protein
LTLELAESFRSIEHVSDVVPNYLRNIDVDFEGKQLTKVCSGISSTDPMLKSKLIVGTLPSEGEDCLVINRYFAYQLGCVDDSEIGGLLGRKLTVRYQSRSNAEVPKKEETEPLPANWLVNNLGSGRVIEALSSLKSQLHEIALPRDQKLVLSQALAGWLDLYQPMTSVEREFEICGVVRLVESEGFLDNVLWFGGQPDDLALHYTVANSMLDEQDQKVLNRGVKVRVDSLANLVQVEKRLKEKGLYSVSLTPFLEHLDNQMFEVRWILATIGLAIYCVSALFISNSMLMSVLERTTEFGIMKAVGASGRQIMGMMLCEGAVIGLAGAVIATIASLVLAGGIERLVQQYVSSRLGESFIGNVFQFSWMEILAAAGVAIVFCTIASAFPAFRASRLDPINAMRSS